MHVEYYTEEKIESFSNVEICYNLVKLINFWSLNKEVSVLFNLLYPQSIS